MSSSYTIKLFKPNEDNLLILSSGKVGALRLAPFSINTCVFDSITGYKGSYQIPSLTSSGVYKFFVGDSLNNLVEDKSFGGDNGIYIPCDDNNWTYDRINSIFLTNPSNNILIGLTGSDINKLAVYGNVSITGNLYASNLSSLTAGITLNQYTLTSSFISSTGLLNTRINTTSSDLSSLSSKFIAVTGNLQAQITSLSTGQSSISSNQTSLSTNLNSLSAKFIASTASLTGATIWNRENTTGRVPLNNTGDYVQIGINSGLTGMKLDVQGQTNLGNTVWLGANSEKGFITWGGNPQALTLNSSSTLNVGISTQAGQMITVASGGNVGINTTTPTSQFAVNGNTSITGVLSVTGGRTSLTGSAIIKGDGTNAILQLYTGAGSNLWNFRNNGILDIGAGTLDFTSDFNINNSFILKSSNGNVGIGNLIPTQKLSVSGNISSTGNIISSTGTDIGLFSLSTGRVGINQSAPTVALEVSGSLVGGQSFSLGKCPNNSIGFAFNRHFPTGAIYDSTRYAFQFTRPSNADRFALEVYNGSGTLITGNAITIDSVGNFGILTNSPSTALDINANTMRLRSSRTPSSSADTGNQGDHCWDSNYLYVCTATNTWKRVALSSW